MHFTTPLSAGLLLLASTVLAESKPYYLKAYTRDSPLTLYHHESGYFVKAGSQSRKYPLQLIDARIGDGWINARWSFTKELTGKDSEQFHMVDFTSHMESKNSNVWRGFSVEEKEAEVSGTLGTYKLAKDWALVKKIPADENLTVFEVLIDEGLWLCTAINDKAFHHLLTRDIAKDEAFKDRAICQAAILYAYDADAFENEFKFIQSTWVALERKKRVIPRLNPVRFPPAPPAQQ